MFDEQERVRECTPLSTLLIHYATPGNEDREIWLDRLMEMDGVNERDLSRLHGELIAYGWLEQRTGVTDDLKEGIVASTYRITREGLRTFRELA